MRLDEAVSDFFVSQTGLVSPATRRNYEYALSQLVAHFGGETEVESLTRKEVRAWRIELGKNGHAPATTNLILAVSKRLFNWLAIEQELQFANLTIELKSYQITNDEVRAIPVDAILTMLNQAKEENDLRAIAMILYLYSTGGRVGGLVNLKMADLDLKRGRAQVVEKGSKTRTVFLDEMAVTALRNYIEYQRPRNASKYVFLTKRRGPFTRGAVWATLKALAARAGIDSSVPVNPHAWRHAFAIGYLQGGGDLSSLSDLLGHSSVTITHEYYVNWSLDSLHEQHKRHNPLRSLRDE
jgi:integrase/recombinase XerD